MAFDYKEWYEKNRDERNKKRRRRYQRDSAYREKIKETSRLYARKKRAVKRARIKFGVKLDKRKKEKLRHNISLPLKVGGNIDVDAFVLGYLSAKMGRSNQTIYLWEKRGCFPKTPIRINGIRFYTKEMVDVAVKIFRKHEKMGEFITKNNEIGKEIEEAWDEILKDYDRRRLTCL